MVGRLQSNYLSVCANSGSEKTNRTITLPNLSGSSTDPTMAKPSSGRAISSNGVLKVNSTRNSFCFFSVLVSCL
jgi:hypothetical protein